jgi:phosphonatase-like hydrolase
MIELVCCDMAGTTVRDDGLVLEAFHRTIASLDLDEEEAAQAESYVIETMGQSKIEVFRALFAERAEDANRLFEAHFVDAVRDIGVREVPGAREVLTALQDAGVGVALTTGFSASTRESLIDQLGWADLVKLRVSPADAGRGRPAPDMLLVCALRAQVTAMSNIAVVGDTASDMVAGVRAGVGRRIGVLTGTDNEERLRQHGADTIIDSVSQLFGAIVTQRSL